jgi:hypothetical protein
MVTAPSYEIRFLFALFSTVLVEEAVALVCRRVSPKSFGDTRYGKFFGVVALASALTLPYLWFVLPAFVHSRLVYVVAGELAVFLAEAALYRFLLPVSRRTALALSFAANLASYLAGELLRVLIQSS